MATGRDLRRCPRGGLARAQRALRTAPGRGPVGASRGCGADPRDPGPPSSFSPAAAAAAAEPSATEGDTGSLGLPEATAVLKELIPQAGGLHHSDSVGYLAATFLAVFIAAHRFPLTRMPHGVSHSLNPTH